MTTPATPTDERRPGYRDLLRTPGAWRFVIPGFLARQPIAMLGIGTVLLVEHTTGSYGAAGIVTAISGVAMALIAPQSGKLTDRFGQRAVLVPAVLLHALTVSLLIVLALRDAPLWALFAAAVPAGATTPPISPMVRARWSASLDDSSPLMTTAAAFESVTDEFTFIVGPVLTTALCTTVHPAAGLVAEAFLILGGGLFFAAQRGTQPPKALGQEGTSGKKARRDSATRTDSGSGPDSGPGAGGARPHAKDGGRSALSLPGVRVLIPALLGIGSVFGGMQVSIAAVTQFAGQPELNGVLYGIFATGNTLAAVAVGTIRWRRSAQARLLIAYPVLVLATAALAAAAQLTPWLALLGALGLVAGLCVAPSMITGFTLVELLVPAAVRTEAFTWLTGAVALGQAAGSMAAGQLTDGFGAGAGFLAPAAGTGLALTALVVFRRRLADRRGGRGSARGVSHRAPVTVD
ncbi:MFS transporter [Streptomyces ovatisporus]|uniref:MFS transporter n=1 Tax=Streptomyces ovatisporus TaxID=1128682 RepID=A0ABV9A3P2_9ACTN